MATKKKTTRKTTAKKKTSAKKKAAPKKAAKKPVKKKVSAKKATAKKATRKATKKATAAKARKSTKKTTAKKTRKRSDVSTARKKRVFAPKKNLPLKNSITIRRIWYTVTFPVLVVAFAAGSFLSQNPDGLADLQANLLAYLPAVEEEQKESPPVVQETGFVLTRQADDSNAKKLIDIFSTIFPDLAFSSVAHDSAQGKRLISQYKPSEIPTVLVPKLTFERQDLVNIVSELFSFSEGYYILNASVVNANNQLVLGNTTVYPSAMKLSAKTPQYNLQLFSDIKNVEARAHEKNVLEELAKWVDGGLLSLQIVDMPQGPDSEFAAYVFSCLAQESPSEYLDFRLDAISEAKNTTRSYLDRKLKRLIGNYPEKCDQNTIVSQIKAEAKIAQEKDGITTVPALLIQKGQSPARTRYTGNKALGDYQLGLGSTDQKES